MVTLHHFTQGTRKSFEYLLLADPDHRAAFSPRLGRRRLWRFCPFIVLLRLKVFLGLHGGRGRVVILGACLQTLRKDDSRVCPSYFTRLPTTGSVSMMCIRYGITGQTGGTGRTYGDSIFRRNILLTDPVQRDPSVQSQVSLSVMPAGELILFPPYCPGKKYFAICDKTLRLRGCVALYYRVPQCGLSGGFL